MEGKNMFETMLRLVALVRFGPELVWREIDEFTAQTVLLAVPRKTVNEINIAA